MMPFSQHVRELITLEGPITVERYMGLCLRHYYATRDPLGSGGDFTTSPEISQMFGELIGLWMLEVWNAMGRPHPVHLVELGPGRGTLMADLLRATKLLPDFAKAVQVHLVEMSPVLKQKQQAMLAASGLNIHWHECLDDVPEGPLLVIANEFFDALPVRQFIATERGWCERLVGLEDDRLIFGLRAESEPSLGQPLRIGDTLEWPAVSIDVMQDVSRKIARHTGAALIIDYGYWGPAFGDTLQAMKAHAYADPLVEPGEADLTAHVDFHRLAQTALAKNLQLHGIATQGDFLAALGIEARATSLKKRATPAQSADIDAVLARLTECSEKGMGELFKVLAVTHQSLEAVPGLPPVVSTP
jgi:NADH dehydrogenase [ubiquinone] 1 alpha subcomplex assembly factor 7